MSRLPLQTLPASDCWNQIGIWGDRSCPELVGAIHCHNCPVFASAGRHFLDAPSPPGYLQEWTERLAHPVDEGTEAVHSVLIFRIGEEWLGLPVHTMMEVTSLRPVHRVPYRGGFLAGLVNIRGELLLCVRLGPMLGIQEVSREPAARAERPAPTTALIASKTPTRTRPHVIQPRLIVIRRQNERWVFTADEVDRVQRFSAHDLAAPPATVARALQRLTLGVLVCQERRIGLLDEGRLFETLRTKLR